MTVEPMTDAGLTKLSKRLLEYADRDVFGLYARDMRCVLARLASAEATISTLTAERDAAVARAMPEPRLMRTVEEVEALPSGDYLIRRHDEMAAAPWRCTRNAPTPWRTVGTGHGNGDLYFIGAWISGPLPDLPTPTAGEPR